MEDASLTAGQERVKFQCERVGDAKQHSILASQFSAEIAQLGGALALLEDLGATPVCADGKIGGNGAMLVGDSSELMLVSRSGKSSGAVLDAKNFCFVSAFIHANWSARYVASDGMKPSSDTPLLWTALHQTWSTRPVVALHGLVM